MFFFNGLIFLQIYSLDIHNPRDCGRKFLSNHQVGLLLFAGIVLSTFLKPEDKGSDSPEQEVPNERVD